MNACRQDLAERLPHARDFPPPPLPRRWARKLRICDPSSQAAGFGFSGRRWLHQAMEWSGSISRSPDKGASPHAGTGSSSRRRRRFAAMDSFGRPPGSALAQRLCGSPLPLIQCDDCMQTVLRLTSATPKHPGSVFFKCKNDGVRALGVAHFDSSFFADPHFEHGHSFV